MEVTVSGRRTTVSEKLRNYAVEKIGKCERYLPMDRAEVHFWEDKTTNGAPQEFCEVTMEGHGHHVRCKVSGANGFSAVDLAEDKLERQLRKLKTKLQNRAHSREKPQLDPDLVPESLLDHDDASVPEPVYRIVKSKSFVIEAMAPDAAALQMDLLNHDFYLFTNDQTGKSAVVYRRDDGDVGLIDVG